MLLFAVALVSPLDAAPLRSGDGAASAFGLSRAYADQPKEKEAGEKAGEKGDEKGTGKSDTDKSKDAGGADDTAKQKERPSVDAGNTLFGNASVFSAPAEVDMDKVFEKIEEYREIKDKGIESSDPRHALLLGKASRKFNCAVRKAAKAGNYDLVAKKGTVKGLDSVPDLTDDVIDRL